jgi:hypothetical protein
VKRPENEVPSNLFYYFPAQDKYEIPVGKFTGVRASGITLCHAASAF